MALATAGPMKPGKVAAVLLSPISKPEKRGAMSRWLMLKPAKPHPWKPTATVSRETARREVVPKYPQRSKKVAPTEKAVRKQK